MAIDAVNEELITFGQAARRARPKGQRPAAPCTIWRWHRKGVSGVKLETICIGGTRYTSAEALKRFFDAVTLARSTQDVAEEPNAAPGTRHSSRCDEKAIAGSWPCGGYACSLIQGTRIVMGAHKGHPTSCSIFLTSSPRRASARTVHERIEI